MKPNQPNYDKYFRRPLAWLLSFGMIASYVPVTHAQEESNEDKEARTYYEDSPVSETATLSNSIPLVGGGWEETLPPVYEAETYDVPAVWTEEVGGETQTEESTTTTEDPTTTEAQCLKTVIDNAIKDAEGQEESYTGYLPTGNYKLTGDLDLGDSGYNLKFVGTHIHDRLDVTLDLNGYTLTGLGESTTDEYGSVIYLEYADLMLKDTGGSGTGTITGGIGYYDTSSKQYYGGGLYASNSDVKLFSGTITGNHAGGTTGNGFGGGLYADDNSTITLSTASISGNSANAVDTLTSGGGIYVTNNSLLTLTQGVVSNNTSSLGDGVTIDTTATCYHYSTSVEGNKSSVVENFTPPYSFYIKNNTNFSMFPSLTEPSLDTIYLCKNSYITLTNLFSRKVPIAIEMQEDGIFTSGSSAFYDDDEGADNSAILKYFKGVDDSYFVSWGESKGDTPTKELQLASVSLSLGDDEDDLHTSSSKRITIADGEKISDVFDALDTLEEEMKTTFADISVTYYKYSSTPPARTTGTTPWIEVTATEAAAALSTGTDVKVTYQLDDGTLAAQFVFSTSEYFDITSVGNGANGTFTLEDELGNEITEAKELDVVTIEVTPAQGYAVETMTATYQGDSGTENITLIENAVGSYSFTMPAFGVSVSVTFATEDTGSGDGDEDTTITPVIVFDDLVLNEDDTFVIQVTAEDVTEGLTFPTYNVTNGEGGSDLTATTDYTVAITYQSNQEGSNELPFTDLDDIKTLLANVGDSVTVTITATATDANPISHSVSFTWEVVETTTEDQVTYPYFSVDVDGEDVSDGATIEVAESDIGDLTFPDVDIVVADGDTATYSYKITATYYDDESKADVPLDIYDEDDAVDLADVIAYLEDKTGNQVTITLTLLDEDGNDYKVDDKLVTFSFTWESEEDEAEEEQAPEPADPVITLQSGYEHRTITVKVEDLDRLTLPAYSAKDDDNQDISEDITISYTKNGDSETSEIPLTDPDDLSAIIDYLKAANHNEVTVYFTVTDDNNKTTTAFFTWHSVPNDYVAKEYTVTVSASNFGSISANGYGSSTNQSFQVTEFSDVTFIFLPSNPIYTVASVTLNGDLIPPSLYSGNRFTVSNITEDMDLVVTFEETTSHYVNLNYNYTHEGEAVTGTAKLSDQNYTLIDFDAINNISRKGYTFEGWFKEGDTENRVTADTVLTVGETLTAKWTLNVYDITFVLKAGTFDASKLEAAGYAVTADPSNPAWSNVIVPTSEDPGHEWTIKEDILVLLKPENGNQFFNGWYYTVGEQINQSTQFTQDISVYDSWTPSYKITFSYNGADDTTVAHGYTDINYTLTLPDPTKTGYTFLGWYLGDGSTNDIGWGDKVESGKTEFKKDTIIYARWMLGLGTLYAHYCDEDGNVAEIPIGLNGTVDGSYFDGTTNPVRPGYDFLRWYYQPEYVQEVTNAAFSDGDEIFAKWEIVNYMVDFYDNYQLEEDKNGFTSYKTGEKHKLPDDALVDPVRAGYDFLGWYYDADCTGDKVDLTMSFIAEDREIPIELFAKWDPKTENIVLDPNGGAFAFGDKEVIQIHPDYRTIWDYEEFQSLNTPTRTGYEFSHWATTPEGGVQVDDTTVFPDDSIVYTIYAQWTPLEYVLLFDLNEGLVDPNVNSPSPENFQVTYDKAVGNLPIIIKQNATFAGWFLQDADGKLAVDSDGDYIQITAETIWEFTEDQTVVAKYTYPITATVTGEGTISTKYGDGIDSTTNKVDVFEGDDIIFTFTPDTGHRIKSITVDDVEVNLATDVNYDKTAKTYTLTGVKEAGTIHFELEMVPIYEITITSGEDTPLENGTFATTSEKKDNVVYVTEGDNTTIELLPNEWYRIKSVTANGENIAISDSSKFTYTKTELMYDVDLVVVFEELPKYTITAIAGEGGSVDATYKYLGGLVDQKMEIYEGESELFKFYPGAGFMVSEVVLTDSSGIKKDVTIYCENDQFLMDKVMENTTITVTFAEEIVDEDAIVVILDANGGNLSGSSKLDVNESGNLESMPADPTRAGYIFTGWWNATTGGTQISTSYIFSASTTIYAQWTEDLTGVDYTVTFETNGGTAISAQLVSATQTMLKPSDPTRTGYTFDGWYTTSLFTTAWDFSKDTVTKDMTLYAKWTAGSTDNNTSVSRVVDHNGNPVVGATVSLIRNGTTYYSATTDSDGYYAFSLLSSGYYNLVVTTNDGYINTSALTVYSSSTTLPQVKLPEYNVSSSVTIATGSLAQTVGGMDTLANLVASKISNFSKILVDIDISSYSSSSSQSTISNAKEKTDVIASYFDVDVSKTVTTSTGTTYTETITDADSLVEIMISIPTVYQGKDSYSIYRIYNGSVDRISTTSNSNSERIVVSTDGTRLSIFVKKFAGSAFALAYSDANSAVAEHDVTVKSYLNGVESSSTSIGSVAISGSSAQEGDVVTVTPYPNFGFSLDNVVVKTDAGKYLTVTSNSNGTYSFTQSTSNANVSVHFNTTLNTGSNNLTDSNVGTTTPQISYFSDVNVTDPFCSAVNEVVSLGLMTGTGNGSFSPHDSITRGMIVAILQYMSGQQSSLVPGFTDVYPTDYYYYAVAWAVSCGIVVGYDDYTFRPDQAITREELAAILYSYSQKFGSYDMLWYFPLSFSDSEGITFWAKDAVTWCVNRDVLSARYNNFFLPQGIATRAEAAVAVVALLNSQN